MAFLCLRKTSRSDEPSWESHFGRIRKKWFTLSSGWVSCVPLGSLLEAELVDPGWGNHPLDLGNARLHKFETVLHGSNVRFPVIISPFQKSRNPTQTSRRGKIPAHFRRPNKIWPTCSEIRGRRNNSDYVKYVSAEMATVLLRKATILIRLREKLRHQS